MANSANLVATVLETPMVKGKISQRRCILTSTGVDLVVHTPTTGYSVYLKSLFGAETNASNLKFKQRSASLTGTVATTNTSTTLTGTGTAFLTDYANLPAAADAEIVIDAAGTLTRYPISSVDGDTQITLGSAATSTVSGKSHARQETIVTPEYAANQGLGFQVLRDSFIMATKTGCALVLNASAAISELLVSTQEGQS